MAPAQRRFYQSAQGDQGAPKRKSVTPVTAFSLGLHLLWVGGVRQEAHMQRPLTLALVLAGVFFLGMIVGYTHVQPEQFEASQPLRQPRGRAPTIDHLHTGRARPPLAVLAGHEKDFCRLL